jgi:hypothetical protein
MQCREKYSNSKSLADLRWLISSPSEKYPVHRRFKAGVNFYEPNIPIAAERWSSRDFYTLRIPFGRSALMLRADSQSVTVTAQQILSARLRAACALFYNFYITDIGHHDIFINLRRVIFGVSSLCAHPKRLSAVLYMYTFASSLLSACVTHLTIYTKRCECQIRRRRQRLIAPIRFQYKITSCFGDKLTRPPM